MLRLKFNDLEKKEGRREGGGGGMNKHPMDPYSLLHSFPIYHSLYRTYLALLSLLLSTKILEYLLYPINLTLDEFKAFLYVPRGLGLVLRHKGRTDQLVDLSILL